MITATFIAVDVARVPTAAWNGIVAGAVMFRDTFWALIFGFALSGVVQAFLPRHAIESRLGDHRARTLVRASAWGAASSSCSYAASAMARSFFRRGADFVTSVAFMVASTNLVVELGLVLLVLLGWTFVVAEGVGGVIMIAAVGLLGGVLFRRRPQLNDEPHVAVDRNTTLGRHRPGWRTIDGWRDVAGFAIGDLVMLRRELVIGYLAAGVISVSVPNRAWTDVLYSGHGAVTTIENLLVAPLIAVVSCVCSIGNVPLAAVLWKGGISFGGVVAFLFADLITLPLLFVYRRYYGTATTARLALLLYCAVVAAGAATEGLFAVWGITPHRSAATLEPAAISVTPTAILDIAFFGVLVGFVLLRRLTAHRTASTRFATDPVCGMQVEVAHAAAHRTHRGVTYAFCGPGCADRFDTDPERYAKEATTRSGASTETDRAGVLSTDR